MGGQAWLGGPASLPRASLPGQENQELGPRGAVLLQGQPPQAHGPLTGVEGDLWRPLSQTRADSPRRPSPNRGPSAWTKLGGVLPAPQAGEAGGVGGGGRVSPLRSDLQKVVLQSGCQATRKRQEELTGARRVPASLVVKLGELPAALRAPSGPGGSRTPPHPHPKSPTQACWASAPGPAGGSGGAAQPPPCRL